MCIRASVYTCVYIYFMDMRDTYANIGRATHFLCGLCVGIQTKHQNRVAYEGIFRSVVSITVHRAFYNYMISLAV